LQVYLLKFDEDIAYQGPVFLVVDLVTSLIWSSWSDVLVGF